MIKTLLFTVTWLILLIKSSFCVPISCNGTICSHELSVCQQYSVTALPTTNTTILLFNLDQDLCTDMPETQGVWRVTTSSEYDNKNAPIAITVRQVNNGQAQSWTLPATSQAFNRKRDINTVARTLCPDLSANSNISLPVVVVDILSVSLSEGFTLDISVEPVQNFQINSESDVPIVIDGILSPQVLYWKFPESHSLVRISSEDNETSNGSCVIISLQRSKCPLEDTLEAVRFGGMHQTMLKSSTFVVQKSEFPSGDFFIVFIPAPLNMCNTSASSVDTENYLKLITVQNVETLNQISNFGVYWGSWIIPPLLAVIIGAVCMALVVLHVLIHVHLSKKNSGNYDVNQAEKEMRAEDSEIDLKRLLNNSSHKVRVSHLAQSQNLPIKYLAYFMFSFVVGIFYVLPALQALVYQHQFMSQTGNQDICYYNFKCAFPFLDSFAFNNNYSNVLYGILGLMFIVTVFVRNIVLNKSLKKTATEDSHDLNTDASSDNKGLPQLNGLYYAIGFALMMEGVMSGVYHICPNDSNFQFDSTFMFVLACMLLVKLMQLRHPDINTKAGVAFFCLAGILICAVIGIRVPQIAALLYVIILLSVVVAFISYIIYHPLEWKDIRSWKDIIHAIKLAAKKHFASWSCKACKCHPRIIQICVYLTGNIAIFILLSIITYRTTLVGAVTGILIWFVLNLGIFLLHYVTGKLLRGEWKSILSFIFLAIGGALWVAALWFFISHVYSTNLDPAVSRAENLMCTVGFYDRHDVWHILSAFALYFSSLVVLTLDDDILGKPISELKVF